MTELPMNVNEAMDSLVAVVDGLHSQRRSAVSASVKHALIRLHPEGFSERAYGFATFRAFLDAAVDAGRISLIETPGSPDVEVRLPVSADVAPIVIPERRGDRVRPDLWTAFTKWNDSALRILEVDTGRAHFLPTRPTLGEDRSVSETRARYFVYPSKFRTIPAIERSVVLGWMKAFADNLSSAVGESLSLALTDERPFQAFKAVIQSANLERAWRSQHTELVAGVIQEWAKRSGLSIDPYEALPAPPAATREAARTTSRRPGPAGADIDWLRSVAHRAVDRMSEDELRQLPVRLGDLLDR